MLDPHVTIRTRVADVHLQNGIVSGPAMNDSPTMDGGQPLRPKSATSSEGNVQSFKAEASIKALNNICNKDQNISVTSPPLALPETGIDPLSHHILQRTNTERLIPQKLRDANAGTENALPEGNAPNSPDFTPTRRKVTPDLIGSESIPKKKGVSFLSRFSIGGKKKEPSEDGDDETEDTRTEGMNAHVFSFYVGANGFVPQHKEPPRYIKVRVQNKKTREFNRMFLAQELLGTKKAGVQKLPRNLNSIEVDLEGRLTKSSKSDGAIWALEFSKDGRYLAAAGRDQILRVWAVLSTPEERQAHEYEEDILSGTPGRERLSAPVFKSKPVREFEGHTGEILDVSWSKNNFLLSSSMDKTVRLWHISRQECLCTFKHKDFVTSIAFHPKDDRFFLAGSLDSILRLWSIPDKSVAFWNQLPDLITAVAFTPDGKTAIAGVLSGLCLFYETEGLKYQSQVYVRSSRGKNAKGSKITGIKTTIFPTDNQDTDNTKVLITSNDSRIRLYCVKDKGLEMKFRGHDNTCSQIRASFSDDGQYVICGSEDRKAYIWKTIPADAESKDKPPLELFSASSDMVTTAIIAPTATRQLLSGSGDPIYDLCNPPPVTLLSLEEYHASSLPTASETRNSDLLGYKKPEESPAYLARTTHNDGLIIVTADSQGRVKCFRLDCAFEKRHQWDASSTFSKKKSLPRTNSIMTRNSTGSYSRRNSLTKSQISLPNSVASSGQSDHILSWRNKIKESCDNPQGDRSTSPTILKFTINPTSTSNPAASGSTPKNTASAARQKPYASVYTASSVSTTSPPSSGCRTVPQLPVPGFRLASSHESGNSPHTQNHVDTTKSGGGFWNMSSWGRKDSEKTDREKEKENDRRRSIVGMLSSDDDACATAGGSTGHVRNGKNK